MNSFFSTNAPVIIASAPGRLDVMGGIADYSGSLLLQMPIQQRTTVSIQRNTDETIRIRTGSEKRYKEFSISISLLKDPELSQIPTIVREIPEGNWAIYIVGCIAILQHYKNMKVEGMTIFVHSDVPEGKGVSSSAALEVAVMKAYQKLYGFELTSTELPLLAQKAENDMVGAPCGLMDQLSTYLGEKNRLLPLQCQPHTVFPTIAIPTGIRFTAIDSGIRHAVSDASYGDVRTAAFMAYSIIALRSGASQNDLLHARNSGAVADLPFKGFLANIPLSLFKQEYLPFLPDSIKGSDFINQYGHSIDIVTSIDPDREYKLKACGSHPVEENFRIGLFMQLLNGYSKKGNREEILKQLGELMFQSHAGYSSIGLGNFHTDQIVSMVREAGSGVHGARITGGGSGGAVCILCEGATGVETAKEIWSKYRQQYKMRTLFFKGSSSGAFYS